MSTSLSSGPVPSVGGYGQRLDLHLRQGATWSAVLQIKNPDGSPVDLLGCTLAGQIRRKGLSADVLKTFAIAVTDAAQGAVAWSLSAADTAGLPAGETTSSPDSRHVYDIELVDSLGRVTGLLWGDVIVLREVTR